MPHLAMTWLRDWGFADWFFTLLEGSKVALFQHVLKALLNDGTTIKYIGIVFVSDL